MANTKKLTKKDYFAILRASYPTTAENYDEVIKFIDHELELLAKKNSAEKKPTAQQTANAEIAETILNTMVEGQKYTIGELIKEVDGCGDFTTSKMSAIVRVNLLEKGLVVRTEDKRKAYFHKA